MDRVSDLSRRRTSVLAVAAFVIMAGAVLVLGLRTGLLEARNQSLVRRFTEPHPGMLVPTFSARSLQGDSLVIGEGTDDRLQVLFFVASTYGSTGICNPVNGCCNCYY